MVRPLRIEFPGAYYHIMNRGLARQGVFADRVDRLAFIQLLADCHEMWGIRVLAYCLLPNHYHLLLQTPEGNLSRVMRHLDGVYTQRYNRRHGRDGPLFRGRYSAILVEEEAYMMAVARYIHQNPTAAGLVRSPEAFEWSSCGQYLTEGRKPPWLDTEQLLGRFPRHGRRAAFLRFTKATAEEPVRAFYESQRRGSVLGSRQFIERLRHRVKKRLLPLREVPEAKAYLRPDAEACLSVVGQVYGVSRDVLLRSRRGEQNEARAMAIYVCRHLAGMKLGPMAGLFGVGGYSAVGSVVARTRRRVEAGGAIARRLAEVRRRLKT
jgi:putative transposase